MRRLRSPRAPRSAPRLGQHFLEAAWVAKVVDVIAASPGHDVIEIGPGRGALTFPLARRAGHVLAVEVDGGLARELEQRVPAGVDVVHADFLALDLVETVRRFRHAGRDAGAVRVAGNLPYALSAPILLKLLREAGAAGIRDAVLMLQHEVAERVVATAGSRPYGPLAIMTTLHADARYALRLPPGAFRPPPRVHSALVTLRFRDPPRSPRDAADFETLVRRLFMQRRKQVANALLPVVRAAGIDPVLICREAGLTPTRRPGGLTLSELIALSDVLTSRRG